jgi:nucleoside-diphosphate-sugar epimerase
MSKRVLVTGAGGFIGHWLCRRLKAAGHDVVGIDIQEHPWHNDDDYSDFGLIDCRDEPEMRRLFRYIRPELVFALAADMGGAGYVFTGEHDFDILRNNMLINIATAAAARASEPERLLFTSSACVYPQHLQERPDSPALKEEDAYPANPDSEYGWEKLMAERLYLALARETDIQVRIARFHNIYGPEGSWNDGREKLPAAACRKVAELPMIEAFIRDPKQSRRYKVDVWGDGEQRRSFCYIQDCLDQLELLMASDYADPLNIGTDVSVSVNEMYDAVAAIAGIEIEKVHDLTKPQGVRGRNADLSWMDEVLGWSPQFSLNNGLAITYQWIKEKVDASMD